MNAIIDQQMQDADRLLSPFRYIDARCAMDTQANDNDPFMRVFPYLAYVHENVATLTIVNQYAGGDDWRDCATVQTMAGIQREMLQRMEDAHV